MSSNSVDQQPATERNDAVTVASERWHLFEVLTILEREVATLDNHYVENVDIRAVPGNFRFLEAHRLDWAINHLKSWGVGHDEKTLEMFEAVVIEEKARRAELARARRDGEELPALTERQLHLIDTGQTDRVAQEREAERQRRVVDAEQRRLDVADRAAQAAFVRTLGHPLLGDLLADGAWDAARSGEPEPFSLEAVAEDYLPIVRQHLDDADFMNRLAALYRSEAIKVKPPKPKPKTDDRASLMLEYVEANAPVKRGDVYDHIGGSRNELPRMLDDLLRTDLLQFEEVRVGNAKVIQLREAD